MNLQTIADAIAATVGTVGATVAGDTHIRTCTADLPDSIATEALLVYPPEEASLGLVMGPRLDDHYTFMVRLLSDPLSTTARVRWLYAWASALRTRIQTNVDLDVAGVAQAEARAMRVELDGQSYSQNGAMREFDVVEIAIDVHVFELTTASP